MTKVSVWFGTPSRWIVPLLALLISGVVAAPVAAKPPTASPGLSKSDRGLGEFDRANIAAAAAEGKKTVTLLIAVQPGQLQKAANGLKALGGTVEAQDKSVDYLKVDVPINRAEEAAAVDGIQAVDVDGLIPMDDPEPNGAQNPIPQTPPDASTPRNNPYLPI